MSNYSEFLRDVINNMNLPKRENETLEAYGCRVQQYLTQNTGCKISVVTGDDGIIKVLLRSPRTGFIIKNRENKSGYFIINIKQES